nr:hypothetical protein [Candidatus Sigynarchaeota archaeon]
METDYVKFFQSFIASMVQIGGINLPKSVSTMLGRNLGEVYKKRGITDQKVALESMFKAMGGKAVSFVDTQTGFKVTTEFPTEFCPIGGSVKPKRHNMFFEGICNPYASGFLSSFNPKEKVSLSFQKCVLKDADSKCIIDAKFTK